MAQKLKEILGPQDGILSCEEELAPVFCKPKLIPLKSITVEKLERMQRDATEKAQAAKTAENDSGEGDATDHTSTGQKAKPDIWSSEQDI
ncbi:unnamed protein product [Enterobius vermicularis]|uniref:BBIP1 n=1 Tax=Enterobius vermicularis TaxID=51028 RepID=A0A0N4VCC7_ENTVE|nr:unnamed protein product [Enterobius vermicularis]